MCEELVAGGVLPLALAAIQGSNEDIQAKGAELVAELAKVRLLFLAYLYPLLVFTCLDQEVLNYITAHHMRP